MRKHRKRLHHSVFPLVTLLLSIGAFCVGVLLLWISTWKLPDLSAFEARKINQSTKIYDRTGTVLLYDIHQGTRRTILPFEDISRNVKNATVAIEDSEFYQHRGIKFTSILRAVLANIGAGAYSQGGSTITQQVVKNSILTTEKTITRKLKEWVLAWKLDRTLGKESILALYLNEAPYGGSIYGIEEASKTYFGKGASDLSVAEAAYLAALPNAPTYYSPYGSHKDELEERKNLVLRRMEEVGFITASEYAAAKKQVYCVPAAVKRQPLTETRKSAAAPVSQTEQSVCTDSFLPLSDTGIKAPHFVMFIRQYLEDKYGKEAVEQKGFKVITTLDYSLQAKAEEIVKQYALKKKEAFDAENAALVAVDPRSGGILVMVGSRDYFDEEIEGNFNATIAYRQPGSAFKPFVYAEALLKGYTPETVVFDVPTEFSTYCNPDGTPITAGDEDKCYRPENYDGKYHGPVSFRNALAQSINVPAIKVLYLAGLKDSLRLAKDMGISTLGNSDQYGLTLVLGGGEAKPLDMTSAYGVFANDGLRYAPTGILRIKDKNGVVVESSNPAPVRVLPESIAAKINDMLSDNKARTPAFSATSPLHFPGRDVAAKTGTTNDFRDAWIIGYTPQLAVGAWAGNNDNRPMHKIAAYIVAPLWNAFMQEALKTLPPESFKKPPEEDASALPPVLRGFYQGNQSYFIDKLSGKLATEFTPAETREERVVRNIHSILYWVDKNNPRAGKPGHPEADPQFKSWEYAVQKWAAENGMFNETEAVIPKEKDPLHGPSLAPKLSFLNPPTGSIYTSSDRISAVVSASGTYPLVKINFFVNNLFIGSATRSPWHFSFLPSDIDTLAETNLLKAVALDAVGNRTEISTTFIISPSVF